jgi:hypothetical protein
MRMAFIRLQQRPGIEAKISMILVISKVALSYLLKMAILIKTRGLYLTLLTLRH